MASAEDPSGSSTTAEDIQDTAPTTADDAGSVNMTTPLTMENSLVGKLNEGRYYINKAEEEFQKCVERLDDVQIDSIRQTHIRLTEQWREVKSTQEFPRCINPKNIHKAHRFADEARHFHKHIVIISNQTRRAMYLAGEQTTTT